MTDRKNTGEIDQSFMLGMLCALAVVHHHGQDTIYDEIVQTADRDKLFKVARRTGNMRWSGMSDYIKRNQPDRSLRRVGA